MFSSLGRAATDCAQGPFHPWGVRGVIGVGDCQSGVAGGIREFQTVRIPFVCAWYNGLLVHVVFSSGEQQPFWRVPVFFFSRYGTTAVI